MAFRYRNPVVLVGDGYLGQITGRVTLPGYLVQPGLPDWAVYGDDAHRRNLLCSFELFEADLEVHNVRLNEKYRHIVEHEQRADCFYCDDAEWLIVACNTPARMAKGAVQALRERGIKAGLFRPISLWPFPIRALLPVVERSRGVLVVEAGGGQLEDEMRLALSHAGVTALPPIDHVRHYGGVLPQKQEIADKLTAMAGVGHG